ncbi:MAG TPA: RluA family pseudouridine synthase [Bacteroidales bacterium]|jgi:23S rRNA pseudouridine1911/1915/1917 synthase|nr:RluA family pseudouridine synthase [Bacteroidales bacterium]HPB89859.1 RluA family pseudouridine synthase [Bacteroidales bacterium]HQN24772.1 RluA family pseudouridine synthase [Bacteroidales bacterium]HQP79613.1 RluA family pseudouridine synthase [Bacteroidales bacterium]
MNDLPTDPDLLQDEEQELFEHYRFVAEKGLTPLRVDKFITNRMEQTSRHRIQLAINAGYVLVNDRIVKANYKVKPLDVVTIMMPYQRRGFEVLPEPIPLDILYEDEDLLVLNKAPGMVVHPGRGHASGTLVNALAYHLGISPDSDQIDERMGVLVHRIDKETSGLLVVAKNEDAQFHLSKQFFDRTVKRNYVALVWGNVQQEKGTIEGNIGRDPNDRLKFKVFSDEEQGKPSITHYKVIERFGYVTMVECILETGRTHQIRVHMNHIGHPLFNDERYGGDRILKGTVYTKYKQFIDNCFELLPRQALHAKSLGFIHPRTGREMLFDSPIPSDMTALIEKWRKYAGVRELEEV